MVVEYSAVHRSSVKQCSWSGVSAGGRCCPSRRGEWWSRLTINLSKHLKREEEALEARSYTYSSNTAGS